LNCVEREDAGRVENRKEEAKRGMGKKDGKIVGGGLS